MNAQIDYGDSDEQETLKIITAKKHLEDEQFINDSPLKETKIDQVDEVKRLREEVQKSFQKVSSRELSCHVRIDNFQRPLTLRTLISWLEDKLPLKVTEPNVWLNSIKTHCYISFESIDDAKLCKETIEGLKYPPTNMFSLVVNYTKLPASEASGSAEAMLKYQDWLATIQGPVEGQGKVKGQGTISKRLGTKKEKLLIQTEGTPATGTATGSTTATTGSSLGKRKSLGQGSGGLAGAMFGVLRNTLQNAAAANAHEQQVKSPRIDRNTTPRGVMADSTTTSSGIVIGSPDHFPPPPPPSPAQTSEMKPLTQPTDGHHKSGRTITNTNTTRSGGGKSKTSNPLQNVLERKELSLDDFFKKTTCTPQLYWLPVSDEEIERRRNQKKEILAK
jgi:hypothetical protein